ncbi:GNAT family N-acetyltransferase [Methylovirgula sp. 4M-Z18]|uniref:GNAT family N-acetyltransferase n=1 Tax=Methylovirgula sp. 4M-Z18 TaxID=2293567 RepID=UPI000E2E6B63|nr:GNAT family N-acetyltransferase [Methylovirgula sp. 4M-Z18]RFB81313.1 GNAT family N-acetyltransferase [Methylovirgula sp. 4M-Z18]
MKDDDIVIARLSADEARAHCAALADILVDCVEGGASVSFMQPLSREKAEAFWRSVAEGVATGGRILLVAADGQGRPVGTVQVILDLPENQPHRAEIAKMLVHRSARKRGAGRLLMQAAEEAARAAGRTLLVLDTGSKDAARLYERQNWIKAGTIPGYALHPEGGECDTHYYYKHLP